MIMAAKVRKIFEMCKSFRFLPDSAVVVGIVELALCGIVLSSVTEVVSDGEIEHVTVILDARLPFALDVLASGLVVVVISLRITQEDGAEGEIPVLVMIGDLHIRLFFPAGDALSPECAARIAPSAFCAPFAERQICGEIILPVVVVVRIVQSTALETVVCQLRLEVEYLLDGVDCQDGGCACYGEAFLVLRLVNEQIGAITLLLGIDALHNGIGAVSNVACYIEFDDGKRPCERQLVRIAVVWSECGIAVVCREGTALLSYLTQL